MAKFTLIIGLIFIGLPSIGLLIGINKRNDPKILKRKYIPVICGVILTLIPGWVKLMFFDEINLVQPWGTIVFWGTFTAIVCFLVLWLGMMIYAFGVKSEEDSKKFVRVFSVILALAFCGCVFLNYSVIDRPYKKGSLKLASGETVKIYQIGMINFFYGAKYRVKVDGKLCVEYLGQSDLGCESFVKAELTHDGSRMLITHDIDSGYAYIEMYIDEGVVHVDVWDDVYEDLSWGKSSILEVGQGVVITYREN